jgi:predicted phage tail component-like protein
MSLVAYIASLPKSKCEVAMNNKYFKDTIPGFKTEKVEGRDNLKFDITTLDIGNSAGSRYRYKKDAAREITVSFGLFADSKEEFLKKSNVFKGKLRNVENAHFVFDDEPGIYFIGTVSSIDISMINSESSDGVGCDGTFVIECYDPYKYSTTPTTVTNNGGKTIGLVNNGSAPTPISTDIVFTQTAGFVGLSLGKRYYQIGSIDNATKSSSQKPSIVLYDDLMNQDRGWLLNQGTLGVGDGSTLAQGGTIEYVPAAAGGAGDGYCHPSSYGDASESWHGPSLTKRVPADSNGNYPTNWRVQWTYDFNSDGWADEPSRIGCQQMILVDQNGRVIIAAEIADSSASTLDTVLKIYMGGTVVYTWRTDSRFYLHGHFSSDYNVWIEKLGNQITVAWPFVGFTKTFTAYESSATLRQTTWWASCWSTSSPIANNLLRRSSCVMHYSADVKNIPNYFQAGNIVTFNSATNKTTVNGIPNWDRVDVGSQPLLLDPGTHVLGITQTSGATIPNVTVTFNERWL